METMTPIEALRWIVMHLQHRPSLRDRIDLVTRDERNALERALEQAEED